MSIYFEEFALGQKFNSPRSFEIQEDTIRRFADLSGDKNRLHLDEDFARRTPFGGRIAHGLLGLSLASGLLHEIGIIRETVLAFTGLEWKFKGPIRIGDRVSVRMEVARLKSLGARGGIVVFKTELLNQDEAAVQEGSWSMLVRRKE
ncbi:MAG: hypothetical protein A3G41_02570 [Elusimicrobia bacterium RIFCSPLOWO2_12_FULL_59_9]|nr:MAG: hypothetical protein A3G41_02570 [Elusimicrobia bacterium RIFCSPLOWO2_12_FULL_59_9]